MTFVVYLSASSILQQCRDPDRHCLSLKPPSADYISGGWQAMTVGHTRVSGPKRSRQAAICLAPSENMFGPDVLPDSSRWSAWLPQMMTTKWRTYDCSLFGYGLALAVVSDVTSNKIWAHANYCLCLPQSSVTALSRDPREKLKPRCHLAQFGSLKYL